MFDHFVILYSDYSSGKRIAYHSFSDSNDTFFKSIDILKSLKKEFPAMPFSFHHLQTIDTTWESVINYDKFFSDATPVKDLNEFKKYIYEDSKVTALDVANLMVSRLKLTHLKLQKLLYLFYCEYIKKYDDKPFNEKFRAWQYGPVIKEVYEHYKIYGREHIDVEDNTVPILKEPVFNLSVSSKFIKTPIHKRIVEVLDNTIRKYGRYTAFQLVDITHVKDGPWDQVYKNGIGGDKIIPYELIKYHSILH